MAYTTPRLLSTTSHHSPLPMFINKSRYCPFNKRQTITCSSSKIARFGIANAMASKEIILLSTAQQPYTTTPFRSTTADHQSFDPSCDHLLVDVIEHAVHIFDTALLEYLGKLEEKLSKESVFSPLLCTIKQLFTNMDKVVVLSELLLLAEKSSITLNLRKMQIIQLCNKRIENMQAKYSEEFPETPKKTLWGKLIEKSDRLGNRIGNFFHRRDENPHKRKPSSRHSEKGPHAECKFTFYYGSNNKERRDEFVKKVKVMIDDPCITDTTVDIKWRCIGGLSKIESEEAQDLSDQLIKPSGKKVDPQDFLRDYFLSGSDGRFVLTYNQDKVLINDDGRKILKVLEDFEEWKNNVPRFGFRLSFIKHYETH